MQQHTTINEVSSSSSLFHSLRSSTSANTYKILSVLSFGQSLHHCLVRLASNSYKLFVRLATKFGIYWHLLFCSL